HSPFVRPDGTICQEDGYDEATEVFVRKTDDLASLNVPTAPTQKDAQKAANFLLSELLVDFPFASDTAKANALALILTPFIRHNVALVPLAVVNATAPGTGKTLFAEQVTKIATGDTAKLSRLS